MALPTFIGIGAPRSGTTWLAQCLDEHPQVSLASLKSFEVLVSDASGRKREKKRIPFREINFFLTQNINSKFYRGMDWYENLFEELSKPDVKELGDITPRYMLDNNTPSLIYNRINPDLKFICCLREQADFFYSWYKIWLSENPEIFLTDYSVDRYLSSQHSGLKAGFYLEHILNFVKLFPKDQFLFLFYDDLKTDPARQLQKVYKFLGVNSSFTAPSTNKRIHTTELIVPRFKYLSVLTETAFKPFNSWKLKKKIQGLNSIKIKNSHFPERHCMSDEIKIIIYDTFKDHNKKLGDFCKRDLSHWNRSD